MFLTILCTILCVILAIHAMFESKAGLLMFYVLVDVILGLYCYANPGTTTILDLQILTGLSVLDVLCLVIVGLVG